MVIDGRPNDNAVDAALRVSVFDVGIRWIHADNPCSLAAFMACTQGLEIQEGKLTQMLEFTEQEMHKNMEALRRDLDTALEGTRQKMEEAIGQAGGRGDRVAVAESTDVVVTLRVSLVISVAVGRRIHRS